MAGKAFHFNGVQAILSDLGCFSIDQINTIATASQAVDDFHEDKLIVFEDGKMFYPVVTAHRMLDHDNLDSRDASNIWMPFHFFPDHEGICNPDTEHVSALVDFVREQIQNPECSQTAKNIIIGILLHIIVDTYTHSGFMGLYCRHNDISHLDDEDEFDFGFLANAALAIGHGEALTYPDDMWRKWSYRDCKDKKRSKNNPTVFMNAALGIVDVLKRLGIQMDGDVTINKTKYRKIFILKKGHEQAFDQITTDNDDTGYDIGYKRWKELTIRGVQSKENLYIKKDPVNFETSEWYVFQSTARQIRSFFKTRIFPQIRIKTKVY